jgi:hypothetical protein
MHNFGLILLALTPFASIFLFFQKESKTMRIFLPYLFLKAGLELYSQFLYNKVLNNAWLISLIEILSIFFYLFILSRFIVNKRMKTLSLFISLAVPVVFIFSSVFLLPLKQFHLLELAAGSFLLLLFCGYFFFELLSFPNDAELLKYPPFWVVTGLLFNYAGIFPFFLFFNFIVKQTPATVRSLQFMLDFLSTILNILLIISFICRLNLRKKSLSFS